MLVTYEQVFHIPCKCQNCATQMPNPTIDGLTPGYRAVAHVKKDCLAWNRLLR